MTKHHVTTWITAAALLNNNCVDCLKSLAGYSRLQHHSFIPTATLWGIRGGSDDEIGTDATTTVDVNEVNYLYESSTADSNDEMKHMRQQWSSVPA
eukprot:scaffold119942_cov76-Cyclotella_meneghiniana.AAC.1